METNYKAKVQVYDSIGHLVTEYETVILKERIAEMKRSYEWIEELGAYIVDCNVDDELGHKVIKFIQERC